jgi:putative PEP-CTERM system histidine kinase
MATYSAALTTASLALAGAVYLSFALALIRRGYWRRGESAAGLAFLFAVSFSSAWGWSGLADVLSGDPSWSGLAILSDLVRYGAWYVFLLLLAWPSGETRPPLRVRALGIGALIVWLGAALVEAVGAFDLVTLPKGVRWTPLAWLALAVFGLLLVEQMFRSIAPDSRWNAKPVSIALAGSFAFDLYLYSQAVIFGTQDVDAYSIRGAVHALMAPLLFVSTARRRDWIAQLRVSRRVAFHSATLLICGGYLLFISGVGYYVRYFGGDWGRALQLAVVFLSLIFLIILMLSGSARARLRVYLGKNFFRYRYDYREEWLKFTAVLYAQNTPQDMGHRVIRGLADLVESPGGGLWMKRPGASAYQQTTRLNFGPQLDAENANSALCEFLAREGRVINLEEYRSSPGSYRSLSLPTWLQSAPQAWLIVPLLVGSDLIGFVVLVSARTRVDANWEVYDLLNTASRQAASFLAQMIATEALLEVRKFDAFNRMSAFVVHDLKNIVTQLSLMLQNAKRLHDNPEFQQDMLMTVENSLEKMRQLMAQLREGTTPAGLPFGVDLGGVLRRIESVVHGRGRQLTIRAAERVVARGHEERLERVIGHVVQNALDATDPAGTVTVELDRLGGQARIIVSDTGQGMTHEFVRDRLFKPFQSTKPTGMGIGAYESFQYIQELGGTISVDSAPGQGTRVTLLVPLFEAGTESDLQLLRVQG